MTLENIPTMTKDETQNQGHTVLYKGAAGTGKTHNILSWPQPIAVAYFDKNLKTLRDAMDAGVDVTPYFCKDYKQFYNEFVPAVVHHEIDAATIAVDTLSPLGIMIQNDVHPNIEKPVTIPEWGIILNRWLDIIGMLVNSTKHQEGKPGYNFVAAVHLKDITTDKGVLIRVVPQLSGAIHGMLEQYFDWVLLCEAKIKTKGNETPTKDFSVRTIPPTSYHTCKGGGLPLVCKGTYDELMKHSK